MAATPPPPQFTTFFTDNDDVEKIRHDIALLSYLLAQVSYKDDKEHSRQKPHPKPKLDPIQPWVHLAFMLTTGDHNDNSGNKVVAVTGKVENDAITAALVARNVSLRRPPGSLPVTKLTLDVTKGRELLSDPSSITVDAPFSEHVTDVFSILRYLFSLSSDGKPRISSGLLLSRLAMFISRRSYRKLRARVGQGKRIWSQNPLQLIHAWYHTSQTTSGATTSTTLLTSKRFILPSSIQGIIAEFGLRPDSPSPSASGHLSYTVSQDNVLLWTNMFCQFLITMKRLYTSKPWTSEECTTLWRTVIAFWNILTAGIVDHLITPDLALHLGQSQKHHEEHRSHIQKAILRFAPIALPARSATASEMHGQRNGSDRGANVDFNKDADGRNEENKYDIEDDEDDDHCDVDDQQYSATTRTPGAPKQSVLRYLRTLCIAVDAAAFHTSYSKRFPKRNLKLQAYVLFSEPSIPAITSATVRSFADKFANHFSSSLAPMTNVAVAFEELAKTVEQVTFDAVEHAEAIVMALACDTAGTDVGSAPGLEVDSAARSSSAATRAIRSIFEANQVPVGVSHNSCFCCHKLATLLKEHAGLNFVLQGTHSTIVPWVPPRGIPLNVLTELRLTLLRVLYDTIREAVDILDRSTQTSPADSLSSQVSFGAEDQFEKLDLPPPTVAFYGESEADPQPAGDEEVPFIHTEEGL